MSQFEQDALLALEDAFAADPLTRGQAKHCATLATAALIEAFGGLSLYIPMHQKQALNARMDAALQQGRPLRQIAAQLGVHRTTVYRRLQRLQHRQREP
ncbi:helix-turn-helix domain-containing protein [Lamprobacter modestohalophilus]|uniref:helix-turn-helix domain-containing protein n=1 Tax=Lamprobacter modestohalophilus TaxID=1064514 RepID=UPI002ADEC09A|nr:helix-turn-helix domain-containing protein [Lamprobacter modestohalophilus]MEA1050462.1 helix-turn-helix domain-containing protein [Lamprobacter modestohalophilus]